MQRPGTCIEGSQKVHGRRSGNRVQTIYLNALIEKSLIFNIYLLGNDASKKDEPNDEAVNEEIESEVVSITS